jgi:hypothetical protein
MNTDETGKDEDHIEIEFKMDGEAKVSSGLCKATDINEEERSVVAVISTDSVDRDSEVLIPKGMESENFEKNPVVPWSHRSDQPPVGKALWTTERAEEIWQLFKGGFLNAFSVGFRPKEGRRPTPDDIKSNPLLADARFLFTKWELLEFSPVTVPANPDAIAQAIKSKALNLSDSMIEELHIKVDEIEEEQEILLPIKEISRKMNVEIQVEPVFNVEVIK